MTEHTLKTTDVYWDAVAKKEKTFEVRRDDRGFQKGDILILVRMVPHPFDKSKPPVEDRFPGGGRKEIKAKVLYVLTGGQLGIEPGFVVMGIKHT